MSKQHSRLTMSVSHIALALALMAPASAAAQAGSYALPSANPPTPLLSLTPGTWTLGSTAGAWNPWSRVNGCDVFGANCSNGWTTEFSYRLDGGAWQFVGGGGVWASALQAAANAQPPVSLALSNPTQLEFTIHDSYYLDNTGTLEVTLAQVTATPEPASIVLMGSGLFAVMFAARSRRRSA